MSSLGMLLERPDITHGLADEAPAGFLVDEVGLVARVTHLFATASVNDRVIDIPSIGKSRRASSTVERIVVGRDDPLEWMR